MHDHLPVLHDAVDGWQWPVPPFAWRHAPLPAADALQPCRIELAGGSARNGLLGLFDPVRQRLRFHAAADDAGVAVPFERLARLELATPLAPRARRGAAPPEPVPLASHERSYRLVGSDGAARVGRSAGHVQAAEGLYLFTPADDAVSLARSFVPRSAYRDCEFGPSAEEQAAARWIASPDALLDAIARQRNEPLMRTGEALVALGLLTPRQLERALERQPADTLLGMSLVADGLVGRADLNTALSYRIGYPFVDVARFPLDAAALATLPPALAFEHAALPLLARDGRLIVAVDRPSRVKQLRALPSLASWTLVPALARRSQILGALTRLQRAA